MTVRRGKFIVLEGGEGAGKSTNLKFISAWLQQRGVDFVQTREPGGSPLAEQLRSLLLQHREEVIDPKVELLLIFAARGQHLQQRILPALAAGKWVLCDRFTDATYAYQGGGRQLEQRQIAQLEQMVQGDLRPDKVFLLDLDPRIGLQRAARTGALDRFEKEQLAFFHRVRAVYRQRSRQLPDKYVLLDAAEPLAQVQRQLAGELEKILAGAAQ